MAVKDDFTIPPFVFHPTFLQELALASHMSYSILEGTRAESYLAARTHARVSCSLKWYTDLFFVSMGPNAVQERSYPAQAQTARNSETLN